MEMLPNNAVEATEYHRLTADVRQEKNGLVNREEYHYSITS